jgi:hypothetical protein
LAPFCFVDDFAIVGADFWRSELEMIDDEYLIHDQGDRILIFFAEVAAGGYCKINGPWSDPTGENLQRVLQAIGCVRNLDREIKSTVDDLYEHGCHEDDHYVIRMVAVAADLNPVLKNTKSEVRQVTWDHALTFIHGRFSEFRCSKRDHGTWPWSGELIWELSDCSRAERFVEKVRLGFADSE